LEEEKRNDLYEWRTRKGGLRTISIWKVLHRLEGIISRAIHVFFSSAGSMSFKFLLFIFAAFVIAIPLVVYYLLWKGSGRDVEIRLPLTKTFDMRITSTAFKDNWQIPKKYTCDGENINPPLTFHEVPEGAESLVLIVDDPDAPRGTFTHWTVWNINPRISLVKENSVPEGAIQGMTDFGRQGYGGPCPPFGTHRYFFKLYALDTVLDLDSSATVTNLERAMEGHILERAELVGLYQRQ
jgi:Raf kinase inhibitor-like YbhB/YbcL family protein